MARYADRLLADGERVALRGRQHFLATLIEGRVAWAIFIAALVLVMLVAQPLGRPASSATCSAGSASACSSSASRGSSQIYLNWYSAGLRRHEPARA